MALFDFNPDLGAAKGVLDARKAAVKDRKKDWNYKKYAYCTVSTTGKSQTKVCPEVVSIGDGNAPVGGGRTMYTTEGGIRRKKPILTSCKITNEGGQDYIDSYIYEAEFSYDVHSLEDMNKLTAAFMIVGGEVEISFGWANAGGAGNSGKILVNVYNFNWSINKDGSFSCTVKAMSGAALFPKESLSGDSEKVEDTGVADTIKKTLGEGTTVVSFFDKLVSGMRDAFGIEEGETVADANDSPWIPDIFENTSSDNKLIYGNGTVAGLGKQPFWVVEMLSSEGTWYNDDELYFSYCNLNTVIKYFNNKLKEAGSDTSFSFASGDDGAMNTSKPEMYSADPTRIVLQGVFAEYGDPGGTEDTRNFGNWKTDTLQGNVGEGRVAGILLELGYLNKVYADLSSKKEDKQGGGKVPPTAQEYLGQIFNDIADVTGGFVQLQLIPEKIAQEESKNENSILIVNRPMVKVAKAKPTTYTFSVLGADSIVRDVSFETDFDANTIMMATINADNKKITNIDERIPGKVCGSGKKSKTGEDPTAATLKAARKSYGDDGFDQAKVTSNSDNLKRYININKDNFGNGYKEIVWPYKLGVTIDGVAGINYMAAITIDRLPDVMTTDNMYFSITSIEHTFDGKGDWETTLGTVMRIP